MPAPNGSRDRGTDATTPRGEAPRTIEDIEQRAAEIEAAERDATVRIGALRRDLAVELPHESKLPVCFAATAKRIDDYAKLDIGNIAARDFNSVVNEWGRDAVEDFIARLQDYVAEVENFLGRR